MRTEKLKNNKISTRKATKISTKCRYLAAPHPSTPMSVCRNVLLKSDHQVMRFTPQLSRGVVKTRLCFGSFWPPSQLSVLGLSDVYKNDLCDLITKTVWPDKCIAYILLFSLLKIIHETIFSGNGLCKHWKLFDLCILSSSDQPDHVIWSWWWLTTTHEPKKCDCFVSGHLNPSWKINQCILISKS